MADTALTLSKALQDYLATTGKTLQDVEREAFIDPKGKHTFLAGLGYLKLVCDGRAGSELLNGPHYNDGAKLLSHYLMIKRAAASTTTPPVKAVIEPSQPRKRHTRKRRVKPAPKSE